MKSKLDGIPRYSSEKTTIPAALYNIVRLALLRLEDPIRFPLPSLKNIEMILDDETWICLDSSLNDIPVLAWTDFEVTHRENLHEPINCQLLFYHQHADKIVDAVIYEVKSILDSRLHQNDSP